MTRSGGTGSVAAPSNSIVVNVFPSVKVRTATERVLSSDVPLIICPSVPTAAGSVVGLLIWLPSPARPWLIIDDAAAASSSTRIVSVTVRLPSRWVNNAMTPGWPSGLSTGASATHADESVAALGWTGRVA